MSKELDDRITRLEKLVGAAGYDIHEFDNPAQAKAHAADLEAQRKAEEKQQAKQAAALEAGPELALATPPRKPRARKPAARRSSTRVARPASTASGNVKPGGVN